MVTLVKLSGPVSSIELRVTKASADAKAGVQLYSHEGPTAITSLEEDGFLARAGVLPGDNLLSVGSTTVTGAHQAAELLTNAPKGIFMVTVERSW